MEPYALKVIPPEDIAVFTAIRKTIDNLPNHLDLGKDSSGNPMELSCHMLARAVHKNFRSVKVKDGLYMEKFNHSWVVTCNGNVIDVYPVASLGGPVMLDCSLDMLPGRNLFTHKSYDGEFGRPEFLRAVAALTKVMARTMIQIGIF